MKDAISLGAVARLFGELLLRELESDRAAELARDPLREVLEGVGLDLSSLEDFESDRMSEEYFEAVLNPKDAPPLVQSLWEEGRYDGEAAASMRKIAEAAGVEFDPKAARGAPPDHLGCSLLLWAELAERSSSGSEFAERHLRWALPALESLQNRGGFYGTLAAAILGFVAVLLGESEEGEGMEFPSGG